jgi:hypothetical protein
MAKRTTTPGGPLSLGQLRTGTLFKVVQTQQVGEHTLTVEGVYQIGVAKADHGRNIRILDLAGMRKIVNGFKFEKVFKVPSEPSKSIEVYTLPPSSPAH